MNWKLINVILLGLAFMLLFTAFQTASMSARFVTEAIKRELKADNSTNLTDDEINSRIGDGYLSMSLLYAVFAMANFFSPSIVKICGHKASMFVSALSYLLYIVMYLFPTPAFMYTASIIIGIGAAVIWTAQGDFLGMQSPTDKLMMRNTGIFWVLFQFSLIIGNSYIYLAWTGKDNVGRTEINLLFTGLSILAGIGTFVFLLLKAPFCGSSETNNEETGDELLKKDDKPNEQKENESTITIIVNGIKNSFALLLTMDMILIAPLFLYSGFSLSFFSGIYTTSVGNTLLLEGAASMLGLVGVGIGLGQVVGGGIFVFGSNLLNKLSRTILLNVCLFIHFGAFVCIYLNIPKMANQDATEDPPAVLELPSKYLALVTAFLLGLGDAGVNNVIYTSITLIWKDDTVSAFGLMKCLQSSASAISFAIASIMNLYENMLLLVAFSILTIITYIILRRRNVEVPRSNDQE